jgi:hypothetical protein
MLRRPTSRKSPLPRSRTVVKPAMSVFRAFGRSDRLRGDGALKSPQLRALVVGSNNGQVCVCA